MKRLGRGSSTTGLTHDDEPQDDTTTQRSQSGDEHEEYEDEVYTKDEMGVQNEGEDVIIAKKL